MATIRDIRRRIKTVRNIQQITKALKMVAAARLQRAENNANAARPYAEEILNLMGRLASAGNEVKHPLLEVREVKCVGVLAITSDRGMAGSYNTNIIRKVSEIIRQYGSDQVKLIIVGKKGRAFFSNRDCEIAAHFPMPASEVRFLETRMIGQTIREMFEKREVDLVHIVYTRYHSAGRQAATDMQLLPVVATELGEEPSPELAQDVLFEPSPEALIGSLLPRYIDVQIYRAMLDSLASEHGARMTAMSSATDNASEMIDRLTLDLNRARQSAITTELIEIIAGADSLK